MTRIILTSIVFCFLSFASLEAQTIYYVKADGTGNGTSWANAAGNIQDMIDQAVAGDQVWVAAGTYYPTTRMSASNARSVTFLLKDGVHLYGGFAGNETSINQREKSDTYDDGMIDPWEFTNETILSGNIDGVEDVWTEASLNFTYWWRWNVTGNSGNCETVVTCTANVTIETRFDGFTVSGGTSTGIYTQGKIIIQNCIIKFNAVRGIDNTIGLVTNCFIHTNAGQGIWNGSGTVSHCTIDSNANYEYGQFGYSNAAGGIANDKGDIINCIVTNNCVTAYWVNTNSPPVLPCAYGGGIYNNSGKIDRCIVAGNMVYCFSGATAGAYNGAQAYGGGIRSGGSAAGDDRGGIISNCVVFNNTATAENRSTTAFASAYGGGVSGRTNTQIYNITTVNNAVKDVNGRRINNGGGGINCIVSSESALTQNFIQPTTYSGAPTTSQQIATLLNADWRLKKGSEFIGSGTIDDLPDWVINGTDLDGNPRVYNGIIDMGAYTYMGALVVTYTVTFDSQGGSTVSSQSVEQGGKVTRPTDPTRTNYTFGGWYKESACINAWNFDTGVVESDITLYAKWAAVGPTTYTVTFDSQGGSAVASQTIEQGGKVTQPIPPNRDGYTFGGWYKESTCTNLWNFNSDVVTGNITLFAKWTAGSVTGTEDSIAPDLKIYPNPFLAEVHIAGVVETGCAPSVQVQIINTAGVIVHTQLITNPDEAINLEHLPAGVYFFRMEIDGKVKTVKAVKTQ